MEDISLNVNKSENPNVNNDTKEKSVKKNEVDPLDLIVGNIGRWQIVICLSIALVKIPVAYHQLGHIFLSPPVSFHCVNPEAGENVCKPGCTSYVFNTSTFKNTINMEWNLICEREWMSNMSQTMFMFGVLLGNIIFGMLADKCGRRKPLIWAVAFQTLIGISSSFAWNWYVFTLIRFILAFFTGGTMIMGFVITTEIVGVKYRQLFSMIFQIPFNIGHALMVGIAYLNRDTWSQFQLWLSIPTVVLLAYYWLIPESPRWLLTVGRTSEAVEILTKGAEINKLPTDSIANKVENMQKNIKISNDANIGDLFKTKTMCMKTVFLCFGWLSCGLCFFGVSQYIGQLGGNIFINVLISALIQLPGTLFVIFLNNWLGRKKTLILSLIVSGAPLVVIAALSQECRIGIIVCSLIGIMGCSMSFPTIYLYAAEVFPTILRNTGMGVCSVLARIGSMIAPFIATLNATSYWIPPVVFGGLPLIAAIFILLLPETHGKVVPNTLDEAENFEKCESNDTN